MIRRLLSLLSLFALLSNGLAFAQDSEDPPDAPLDVPAPPSEPTPATPPATPAPAAATAAPSAEPTKPATPRTVAPLGMLYARPNRLGLGLSFGFGSASLSEYHDAIDGGTFIGASPDDFKTNLQISAELSLRYYGPYHLMGQIGYGAVYNSASSNGLEMHNLLMEVPILIGGYYAFFGRLYVHGALGPAVLFYGRGFWDPGTDFEADSGVGMHVQFGAEYLVGEHFGFGLDFRYRAVGMGELKVKDTDFKTGVDFDMSGVAMILNIRVFAL